MANLTAAQIATILKAVVYPPNEGVEVNAALMQNEERRKYPSIDVQNVTGDEQLKDFPTTTLGQTFLIHLFYRYRSFGEQEEPQIKVLEDLIFDAIDNDANFTTDVKVTITQSWQRESETFPVHRSHSTLTVTAEEISSTDGSGLSGNEMTLDIPGLTGQLKIINLSADDRTLQKSNDKLQDGEEVYTKIHLGGLFVADVELSFSQETEFEAILDAGDDISITITKSGNPRVLVVNPTSMVHSASRDTIQTTLLTFDVKP